MAIDWSNAVAHATADLQDFADYAKKHTIVDSLKSEALFAKENVTKDDHYIHAGGEEKLVEYLLKLSEVLRIGKFKPGAREALRREEGTPPAAP